MIAGPLASIYHKNAAYFFNPDDLRKIDRSLYEHVWLIVPTTEATQWVQTFSDFTLSARHTAAFGSIGLTPVSSTSGDGFSLESVPFGSGAVIFEIE